MNDATEIIFSGTLTNNDVTNKKDLRKKLELLYSQGYRIVTTTHLEHSKVMIVLAQANLTT